MASNRKNTRLQHILGNDSPFAVTEAYKSTRTSLLFSNINDGCNVLAFTSSVSGEGKTVTCINVAISLAQSGKKVLVIDSDMRKPQVAASLRLSGAPGLSEILSGVVDIDELSCVQKTEQEGLSVITSGSIPPNPAELISCARTDKLFEKLTAEYDYILIDTPPSMVVTDALLYKKFVAGYVVVVRSNYSRADVIQKLLARFEQVDARVIGLVLNDKEQKHKGYGKYGRYGRYGRYGKYGRYGNYYNE